MSNSKAEAAVAYAALILADGNVAITPDKLHTLLRAAGIEDVEPIWTQLFTKALEGKDLKEILTTVATSAPAKTEEVTGSETEADGKSENDGGSGDEAGEDEDESDEDLGNLFDL